jgi:hypothetical protein
MRLLILSLLGAAVVTTAAATSPAGARRDAPSISELSRYRSFTDSAVAKTRSQLALAIPDTTPYTETLSSGETLSIRLSKSAFGAGGDPTAARQWADFFDSLLHGTEISLIQIYLLTPTEISDICGRDALACYGGNQLFTPAEDPASDLSAESVAAHEYGHHVAEHRVNPPWTAIDWGPKRWASAEQVCANERAGRFVPGAEDAQNYQFNPGEGWAETYRYLNEQRLGLPHAPWEIVSDDFFPSAATLAAAQLDITSPWSSSTRVSLAGSVSKKAKTRTFAVQTPLDGTLSLSLQAAKGERLSFDLLSSSTRLVHRTGRTFSASTKVCGQRTLRARVTRLAGSGRFSLAVSRP